MTSFTKTFFTVASLAALLALTGCNSQPATPAAVPAEQKQPAAQPAVTPPAPSTATTDGWKTYTNSEFGFQMQYPDDFVLSNEKDWGPDVVASLESPDAYKKGTNLNFARIELSAYKDPGNFCLKDFSTSPPVLETNNGIDFSHAQWVDGAAGSYGKTYQYRASYKGACYDISLVEYAGNMGMWADGKGGLMPGAPKAFDSIKILSKFYQMFETYKFTK